MRSYFYKFLFLFYKLFLYFHSDTLRVLAYHDIKDPGTFEAQLQFIKKNFNVIDINFLQEHLFQGKKLPKKALFITFDDGDISVFEKGLPLLKKYSIPSICFVITDLINSQKAFWWDEIRYYLGKEEGNIKSWEVKIWKNEDRENFLYKLREQSQIPLKGVQLNINQLHLMKKEGVDIGNHSHTHPMLNKCTIQKVRDEIVKSSFILKENGFSDKIFAYPNGNFDQGVENVLKENKVNISFLFDHRLNPKKINPMRISRLRVDADTDLVEFKVKVSGLHSFIYNQFTKKIN